MGDFKKKAITFNNDAGNHGTIRNESVGGCSVDRRHKEKLKYVNMSQEEVDALEPKEKSKASLIRNNFYTKNPGHKPNPKGKNQYTEKNELKAFAGQHQKDVLEALKAELPSAVKVIRDILLDPLETAINRLRASELLIAYQLAKPVYREKEDKSRKTFIILPENTFIEKGQVVTMPRVENPEGTSKKK